MAKTSASSAAFHLTQVQTRKGRTLQVRECSHDDLGALVAMYKDFAPKRVAQGLPPADLPRLTQWLDCLEGKSRGVVALDNANIVGHAVLCPFGAQHAEYAVFVHQDYREEGVGTALSELTFEWAARTGVTQVYLTTENSNFPAMQLFRKLGFQLTSSMGDEVEMKLDLVAGQQEAAKAA